MLRGGVGVGVGAGLVCDAGCGEVQRGEADDPVGGAVADELQAVVALAADAAALERREDALDAVATDQQGLALLIARGPSPARG